MRGLRQAAELVRRLHAILGAPGLMIGVFALLSFGFGLVILAREYDRPRQSGREVVRRVVDRWVRIPDYLGLTLVDHADLWREAPEPALAERQRLLAQALEQLGNALDRQNERFPLVHVTALDLRSDAGVALASWSSPAALDATDEVADRLALTAPGERPAVELRLRYQVARAFEDGVRGLETSYRRLLLALLGLSGFCLLCLAYMVLHARSLSERVAREAAQEATLDLADRTCHELGNGVFVLANERRNLEGHLDLVERFIAEDPAARAEAARRAGLDAATQKRWESGLRRAYADRGIDPDLELRASVTLARHVCRQIDVCSQYIGLTVRELDGFLKRSALPVELGPVAVSGALDESLALLRPRLESAGARVVRGDDPAAGLTVVADRRLLIHALVNLIKNGVEAAGSDPSRLPQVTLTADVDGRTAWIGVADNGPGLTPDAARRLFEVGYSTKGAGRGRGLPIVRESVHAQYGQLTVESPPAGGALFRIGLDVAAPAPATTA